MSRRFERLKPANEAGLGDQKRGAGPLPPFPPTAHILGLGLNRRVSDEVEQCAVGDTDAHIGTLESRPTGKCRCLPSKHRRVQGKRSVIPAFAPRPSASDTTASALNTLFAAIVRAA